MNTTDETTASEKPDYEIAREELSSLYDKKLPQAMIIGGELRENEDGWKHRYYEVKIGDASFKWMQGTGIKGKPNQAEVIGRCCADYISSRTTFQEWCSEFGYDSDSIKAERVYQECQSIGQQLRKLQPLRYNNALITQFAELANRL